jgi:uncharacterized coiled-coil protein SlyX
MPEIKPTNQTNSTFTNVTSGQSSGSFTTEKGEVMIDEQRLKSLETQRLTLESVLVKELNGIIKKLNDEVDMLTKQKQFLQSKLREATDGNKKSDS